VFGRPWWAEESALTSPSDLLGAWEIIERLDAGKADREPDDDSKYIWFLSDRMVSGDEWAAWDLPYAVRSSQGAGEIDVTRSDRLEPWLQPGIFEVAGRELKLCMAGSRQESRPTSFSSTEANGCVLYVARRSEKELPK
jgi:hypothetical protein